MLQKKVLRDTLLQNASSILSQGCNVARQLLVMKLLAPQAMGIWLGLLVFLRYASFASFGAEHGLGFRLPYHKSRDEQPQLEAAADSVYVAWTGVALVLSLGALLWAVFVPGQEHTLRVGIAVLAAIIAFDQQSTFFNRWQTSVPVDFSLGSKVVAVQSVVALIVTVPLAYAFGVVGVMFGQLATSAVSFAMWRWKSAYRFSWRYSFPALAAVLQVGFPVLVVVAAGALIESVDRLLILFLLGAASLGYYGVTGLGGGLLYGLLAQAGSALSPHIVAEMGQSNDSPQSLRRFLVRPTLAFAGAAAILLSLLIFAVVPLVDLFLPQYRPGLPAFYAFIPGFFFLAAILSASNIVLVIMMAQGHSRLMVYLQAAVVLVEAVGVVLFVHIGWGLVGVAVASTLAYALNGMLILWLSAHYVLSSPRERWSFIAQTLTPFAYMLLVSWILEVVGNRWFPHHLILRAALQITGVVILSVPLVVWLDRRLGLLKLAFRRRPRAAPDALAGVVVAPLGTHTNAEQT